MQCLQCAGYFHWKCVELDCVARGPWFCPACRKEARRDGQRDLVLDLKLMHVVVSREVPATWTLLEAERRSGPIVRKDSGMLMRWFHS